MFHRSARPVAPKKKKKKHSRLYYTLRTFGLRKEVYFYIANLSTLLGSGMNILDALRTVAHEIDSFRMRPVAREVEEEVLHGLPLYVALRETHAFPQHVLALIELGEMSGHLSQNLAVAALQNDKEMQFRARVRSSLLYITIVFSLTLVVSIGTAWFTLPKMAAFFNELNAPLPPLTRVLIAFGEFLGRFGAVVVPAAAILIGGMFYFLFSFPKTKFIGHHILFHLPLIKRLIRDSEVAKFGYLLGTMFDAGMPIVACLEALQGTTTFQNYRKFYVFLTAQVKAGSNFAQAFDAYPHVDRLFPSFARQMVGTAEQSGALGSTLAKIGAIFEERTEATARDLPVILEPVMILIIGAGVAVIALGTLMPMYNLSGIL